MNQIETDEGEKINDDDAAKFYALISQCIDQPLDPSINRIKLSKPEWGSRSSAKFIVKCEIDQDHFVILKRCVDNPEYLRREFVVGHAKKVLKWEPFYNVIKADRIQLRKIGSDTNCKILSDWGEKPTVIIDIQNYKNSKIIKHLTTSDIKDFEKFCFDYGKCAALNYLLTIRDRNDGNFCFFLDKQTLHSIDTEDGPFDSSGNNAGTLDIVNSTKQQIKKFLPNKNRDQFKATLISGFTAGWNLIEKNKTKLTMFNDKEIKFLNELLSANSKEIGEKIFNDV